MSKHEKPLLRKAFMALTPADIKCRKALRRVIGNINKMKTRVIWVWKKNADDLAN